MRWIIKHPVKTILILACLLPVFAFVSWYLKPGRNLNVFIMDKTVPRFERYEHKSINWILNQEKFVKSDGSYYNPNVDYYGFFPIDVENKKFDFRRVRVREVEELADKHDVAYFADTYGVFYNEWYQKREKFGESQRIFGGLNNNDYLLLSKFIEKEKLVLTEFNLFASPTNKLVRNKTEKLLGVKWSGWTGKYYAKLDTVQNTDLPIWIVNLYMKDNQNKWPFTESGIIFIKGKKVVVLENKTHLNSELPIIYPREDIRSQYSLEDSVHYTFWFDINTANKKNEVLAEYKLNVNRMGELSLQKHNIPTHFPAVIRNKTSKKLYYFCGDFADNALWYPSCYLDYIDKADRMFYSSDINDRKQFFWKFYRPFMSGILNEYYDSEIVLTLPDSLE